MTQAQTYADPPEPEHPESGLSSLIRQNFPMILMGIRAKASEYYRIAEQHHKGAENSKNEEFIQGCIQRATNWQTKALEYDSLYEKLIHSYSRGEDF